MASEYSKLFWSSLQESNDSRMGSVSKVSQAELAVDKNAYYRANMANSIQQKSFDLGRTYYAVTVEDSRIMSEEEQSLFGSVLTRVGLLFGLLSPTAPHKVTVIVPGIHTNFIEAPNQVEDIALKQKYINQLTECVADPTFLDPTQPISANKVCNIKFLDQNFSRAKILEVGL